MANWAMIEFVLFNISRLFQTQALLLVLLPFLVLLRVCWQIQMLHGKEPGRLISAWKRSYGMASLVLILPIGSKKEITFLRNGICLYPEHLDFLVYLT